MRRALLPMLVAGIVAGASGLGPTALAARSEPAPAPAPTTAATLGDCAVNAPTVPRDFLGLSIEWSMVQHWFGTSTATAQPAMVELLRQIGPDGVLRIGGNSQDDYRWVPDGDPTTNRLFGGVVTTGMVDALLEVARRSGWHLVLGLNLKADEPEEAAALVRYAATRDTTQRLLAVAPGNEPNAYFASAEPYLERYGRYVDALDADPLARLVPLTGPDVSNNADLSWLKALRRAHGSRLAYLGWHAYGNRPSLASLLGADVQQQFSARSAAARGHASATPHRMSEGNSVGMGGLKRVSDVTGSTAWTMDTVLLAAREGLAGYHLHAWDKHYYPAHPLRANYTPLFIREGQAFAAPGFYALALLRELGGKRFCTTALRDLAPGVGGDLLTAYGLSDLTGDERVLYLVNKGTTSRHSAHVTVTLPRGEVAESRVVDTTGCGGRRTTVNGATLQRDGSLSWTPAPLTRAVDGTVTVTVSPCQTVLLQVTGGGLQSTVRSPG